jgi:hypothetical protein
MIKTLAHPPRWWTSQLSYNGIHRVCAAKEPNYVETDIKTAIDDPITFQDFNKSLNTMFNKDALAPTTAATQLVKAWSPEISQLLNDYMTNIWVHRLTPILFKDKVKELASKITGNSELENMMPISLCKIMRKACTAIVSKRISTVGIKYEVLNPGQCGYVPPQLLHHHLKILADMQDGLR